MRLHEALDALAVHLEGERQDGYFTQPLRIRYLNLANRKVAADFGLLRGRTLFTATGNYPMPPDINTEVRPVLYHKGQRVPLLTYAEAHSQYPSWEEYPTSYHFFLYDPRYENRLRLFPNNESYTLTLDYARKPQELSLSDDSVEILEGSFPSLQELVPLWAAFELWALDGKIEKAQHKFSRYQMEAARVEGFPQQGTVDVPLLLRRE